MSVSDTLKGLLALGLPTDSGEFEIKTKETASTIVDDSVVSNQKVYSSSKIETRLAEITALADEIDGEVDIFSELPSAQLKTGKIYIVHNSSGAIFINRKSAGLYRSSGTVWSPLSDFDAIAAQLHANTLAINGKESSIALGTQAQYLRGDKTWQTLSKNVVGLNNVDNTTDIDKPLSTAAQEALDGKEPSITSGAQNQYIRGDKTLSDFASDVAQAQASAMALKANLSDLPSVSGAEKFADLLEKPTTLSGYGISDAYTKTAVDLAISQKVDSSLLSPVAFTGSYNDLRDRPIIPGIYPVSGADRYDATSMGPVLSVDVIANYYASGILPSSGRLTYILAKNGGNQEVTVSYRKTGSTISQSAFTLSGNTLTYTGDTQSILLYANDDHDSLFVDASGAGILSRANANSLLSGTWDKFRGSTELVTNSALNSVLTYPFASNAESNASIVSFPGTNSAVLLNLTAGTYKVNNGDVRSMPAPLNAIANSSTWPSPTNSLWTISDGINQFMIGRYGSSTAYVVTVDLMSYAITVGSIALSATPSVNNATEEDCIGTQLFSIDGVATWLVGTTYYYGGALDWKTNSNVFNTSGKSSFTAGSVATSTDMDIWGSIDNSGYVWFADWGHDDGGLFGIGNDDRLNTRPTNIKYVAK